MQVHMAKSLRVAPPVGRFSLLDVSRFHLVVKAGYEDAMARLPDWFATQPEGLAAAAARADAVAAGGAPGDTPAAAEAATS